MPEPQLPSPEPTKGDEPTSAPVLPAGLLRELRTVERAAKVAPQLNKPAAVPTVDAAPPKDAQASLDSEASVGEESPESNVLEDPKTDAAVDDIVHAESDELIGKQLPASSLPAATKPSHHRLRHLFRHAWVRWTVVLTILGAIGAAGGIPASRYWVLNHVGVRASLSLSVTDMGTVQPLKSVIVSAGGQKAQTMVDGTVRLRHLTLGPHRLTISRLGFAAITKEVVIGWGSNPLGSFALRPVGLRYTVQITDDVSGKPIAGATVTASGLEAAADATGKAEVTLDPVTAAGDLSASVNADGYHPVSITLNANAPVAASLLPTGRDVFVARQGGRYNVVSTDLDGTNQQVVLAGSGNQNSNNSLAISPDGAWAAFVSTRDGVRDSDGYAESSLALIHLTDGRVVTVDHGDQIQLVDWVGSTIVYALTSPSGTPAAQASQLISYDATANARVQLAVAPGFDGVVSANGAIYFAASGATATGNLGLFEIHPDGQGKKTLLNQQVWGLYRTAYDTLTIQTPASWYSYAFDSAAAPQIIAAPGNYPDHVYVTSPSGKQVAWIDSSAGTLHTYDVASGADHVVATQPGLTYPLHWLGDNLIVVRVGSGQTVSDFVASTAGGAPKKIADTAASFGLSQGQ